MQATLVIRFGSLGDVILTSPAVLNLKFHQPDSRLIFLTKKRFRGVAETLDGVDEVVTIPDHATPAQLFKVALQLEDVGFDRIVDLHGNPRSWFVRTVLTANRKVVYPKRRLQRRAAVRRHRKVIPNDFPHTIDLYNRAVASLGAGICARRPVLTHGVLSLESASFVERNAPVVLLAPGAAHPNKQWPLERFAALAERLTIDYHAGIVWALTGADAPSLASFRGKGDNDLVLVDAPLGELAALLARVDLTVSNDSGLGHLSSAVGTSTLVLFGPTHPVLGFAPRGLRDRVVQVDEPCRPCSLHGAAPCFREERFCFTRLSVDAVFEAAAEMLDRRGRHAALLVDRDGTLIANKHYLSDPEEIEFIDGSIEALKLAREKGYRIVLVSNQSGVARGLFPIEKVHTVNDRITAMLRQHGVEIDGFYFCPHYPAGVPGNPYVMACECRKPAPGMAEQAALALNLDLRRAVVIGDSLADTNMARAIGARRVLVRTGYGNQYLPKIDAYTEVAEDLLGAVRSLV